MCKCISNELHIHTQTFEYIYKYLDEQQKKEEGGVHVNIHICSTIIFIVLMPFVKTRNDISATNVMKLYTDTHTHQSIHYSYNTQTYQSQYNAYSV